MSTSCNCPQILRCNRQRIRKTAPEIVRFQGAVVRDGRLELPTSCSQSKRATNCANPGFLVIEFCARCGQTCGHGDFLTTSTCGGSACIAGVSRDCGHGIFRLEGGATRSQSRRATNCATPGYSVYLSGWPYSPKGLAVSFAAMPVAFLESCRRIALQAKKHDTAMVGASDSYCSRFGAQSQCFVDASWGAGVVLQYILYKRIKKV